MTGVGFVVGVRPTGLDSTEYARNMMEVNYFTLTYPLKVTFPVKEPRSKNLSPLGKYLWEHRISDRDFAQLMKLHLAVAKFSTSTVENWRYGKATPSGERLIAIRTLTGLTTDQILGTE
jgi:hypothetical protein